MMLQTFHRVFCDIYGSEMEKMGFKRKGRIFHKLVNNQIVLVLSYKRYFRGNEFTIQFSGWPLCNGYELTAFMDSNYNLQSMVPLSEDPDWFWCVTPEQTRENLLKSLEYSKKYIFSYFEKIVDYRSYFEFTHALDYPDPTRVRHHDIENLDLLRYDMVLLACNEYELALAAKKAKVDQSQKALDQLLRNGGTIERCSWYPDYCAKVKAYSDLTHWIQNNETEKIAQLIAQNESYSLQTYKKHFGVK